MKKSAKLSSLISSCAHAAYLVVTFPSFFFVRPLSFRKMVECLCFGARSKYVWNSKDQLPMCNLKFF